VQGCGVGEAASLLLCVGRSVEIWLLGYSLCEFNGDFIVIVLGLFLLRRWRHPQH